IEPFIEFAGIWMEASISEFKALQGHGGIPYRFCRTAENVFSEHSAKLASITGLAQLIRQIGYVSIIHLDGRKEWNHCLRMQRIIATIPGVSSNRHLACPG